MTVSQRQLLKTALIEACKDDFSHLPPEEEIDIVPSERFVKKMQKLIRSEKRSYYVLFNSTLKKAVAVAALIALIISTTTVRTVNISADTMPTPNFYTRHFPKYSYMCYYDSVIKNSPREILEHYTPTYVPEGYKLHKVSTYDNILLDITYKNDNGSTVTFSQKILYEFIYNDENAPNEYLKINDNAGIYFYSLEEHCIIWDNAQYTFIIHCGTSKDDAIRMAESVKLDEDFEEQLIEMIKNKEISR